MKRTPHLSLSKIGKDRFAILFLAGMLLMVIAIPAETVEQKLTGSKTQQTDVAATRQSSTPVPGQDPDESVTDGEYCRELEKRLEELLSYVDHAGKVKVFVSVSESTEKIVEKDNPNVRKNVYETGRDGDNKNTMELTNETETVYTEDENGHRVPFVTKEISPVVRGVVVVAQGGGNETVKNQIVEVIEALFGIDPHKIKVVKMKGE